MKLTAELSGELVAIDIRRDATRVVATIGELVYDVEVYVSNGIYLLLADGHVYECRVDRSDGKPESLEVTVNNRTYNLILTDPKRLRGTKSASSHADGAAQIIAPMPGKVVRVLVDVGAEVEAGAGIIVVEAMKMQNELKSPKAGKVTAINVMAGATVNAGDVLAIVE